MDAFVNKAIDIVGGGFGLLLVVLIYICSLKMLLYMSSQQRFHFRTFATACSYIIGIFSLLLLARDCSWYRFGITFWWVLLLRQTIPVFSLFQFLIIIVLQFWEWIKAYRSTDVSFLEIFSDFVLFLFIPSLFELAQLDIEAVELTTGKSWGLYGPRIPVSKFLDSISSFINKVF